uniref:Uncharacterized protein n=1 Tax=Glossina pallidipes TaxID=7398 RepID=A0A1A9ZYD3_GLOPL
MVSDFFKNIKRRMNCGSSTAAIIISFSGTYHDNNENTIELERELKHDGRHAKVLLDSVFSAARTTPYQKVRDFLTSTRFYGSQIQAVLEEKCLFTLVQLLTQMPDIYLSQGTIEANIIPRVSNKF